MSVCTLDKPSLGEVRVLQCDRSLGTSVEGRVPGVFPVTVEESKEGEWRLEWLSGSPNLFKVRDYPLSFLATGRL